MRPVKKNATPTPPFYEEPNIFSVVGLQIDDVLLNTTCLQKLLPAGANPALPVKPNPTYGQAYAFLDCVIAKERSGQALTATETKLSEQIMNNLSRVYPGARQNLIDDLGIYCSYCGIPVISGISVEHTIPKSVQPQFMLTWANFLVSCPSCNSVKSDHPFNIPSGIGNKTDENFDDFVWPDVNNTVRAIQYKLIKVTNKKNKDNRVFPTGDEADIAMIGNMMLSPNLATISLNNLNAEVNVAINDGSPPFSVAAILIPQGDQQREAKNTIETMFKFNGYSYWADVGDRRLTERTLTWLWAVQATGNLITVPVPDDADMERDDKLAAHNAMIAQIKDTMFFSGYWSVWATVIETYGSFLNFGDFQTLLNFLANPANFAGTDPTRL